MITSTQNSFIKMAAGLRLRKNRDSSGLFIIEGEKFAKEVPDGFDCTFVIGESFAGDRSWFERRAEVRYVSDAVFRSLSDTVTPQGVLAVVRRRDYDFALLDGMCRPFVLLCEDIRDPGNLGTLLRTADAAGCGCVILTKGSADVYNPKTLRATAGSVFHIPVIADVEVYAAVAHLQGLGVRVAASVPAGGVPAHKAALAPPCAIMIGNEGRGLSALALALADTSVTIPMPGRAESLNAAAAAAMLIYEVVRQGG